MDRTKHKNWWTVKGLIIPVFGTVSACAARLECSPDALRKAVDGKCPRVAEKLKAAIGNWEASAV